MAAIASTRIKRLQSIVPRTTDGSISGGLVLSVGWSNVLNDNGVRPEDSATVGAPAGTFINGVPSVVAANHTINYDTSNDQNPNPVADVVIASDGTAVDHVLNSNGSADISLEWTWAGTEADIDGFLLYLYTSTSSSTYVIGATPNSETVYSLSRDKRSIILPGVPSDKYYTFGVQAYRAVHSGVAASGVIRSSTIQPALAAENPYRPSANVAFSGNITGTINGVAYTGDAAATYGADLEANVTGQVNSTNVHTLVADNTITNTSFAYTEAGLSFVATGTQTLQSSAITTNGGTVVINYSCVMDSSFTSGLGGSETPTLILRVKRGVAGVGTQTNYCWYQVVPTDSTVTSNTTFAFNLVDEPVAGTYTYTLEAVLGNAGSGLSLSVSAFFYSRSLTLVELVV